MTRPYCPTPQNCNAGKRGVCACQVDVVVRAGQRMKALNADPEFKAKSSERMKALNADPEFKAKMGFIAVPDHLKSYALKLRRHGIRGDDLRKAIEAAT